jgi:hypothetical protein
VHTWGLPLSVLVEQALGRDLRTGISSKFPCIGDVSAAVLWAILCSLLFCIQLRLIALRGLQQDTCRAQSRPERAGTRSAALLCKVTVP